MSKRMTADIGHSEAIAQAAKTIVDISRDARVHKKQMTTIIILLIIHLDRVRISKEGRSDTRHALSSKQSRPHSYGVWTMIKSVPIGAFSNCPLEDTLPHQSVFCRTLGANQPLALLVGVCLFVQEPRGSCGAQLPCLASLALLREMPDTRFVVGSSRLLSAVFATFVGRGFPAGAKDCAGGATCHACPIKHELPSKNSNLATPRT